MKNVGKFIIVIALALFCGCVLGEDAPIVPAPHITQSPVLYVVTNILAILAVPIAAGIGALVHIILSLVIKKYNLQISQQNQELITDASHTAVMRAEAWSENQKDKPSSSDKLNMAVQTVRSVLGSPIAKDFTDHQLSHFVEEAVYKLFNQSVPPGPATTETPKVV